MRPRVPLNAQMHLEFFPPSRVLIVDKRGGGGGRGGGGKKEMEGRKRKIRRVEDRYICANVCMNRNACFKHDFPLKKRIPFARLD